MKKGVRKRKIPEKERGKVDKWRDREESELSFPICPHELPGFPKTGHVIFVGQ